MPGHVGVQVDGVEGQQGELAATGGAAGLLTSMGCQTTSSVFEPLPTNGVVWAAASAYGRTSAPFGSLSQASASGSTGGAACSGFPAEPLTSRAVSRPTDSLWWTRIQAAAYPPRGPKIVTHPSEPCPLTTTRTPTRTAHGHDRRETGRPAVRGRAPTAGRARVPGEGGEVDAEARSQGVQPVSGECPVDVQGEGVVEMRGGAQAPRHRVLPVPRR
ncbi:hypothetical protein J2Z21_001000 [Streptomyces griseochromogenes]|uniref:Uncharacterized protein n=1 Tax=Streptomyces griseochromogenes TaxID=68214 RepID=A0ABS4LLJ5_9ACTN|nr:hypothetical protein [Streptomyces griseochromogenes]MBP2048076.1 hypothetical protein [Streptomyces griseochromogenes]